MLLCMLLLVLVKIKIIMNFICGAPARAASFEPPRFLSRPFLSFRLVARRGRRLQLRAARAAFTWRKTLSHHCCLNCPSVYTRRERARPRSRRRGLAYATRSAAAPSCLNDDARALRRHVARRFPPISFVALPLLGVRPDAENRQKARFCVRVGALGPLALLARSHRVGKALPTATRIGARKHRIAGFADVAPPARSCARARGSDTDAPAQGL